MMRTNAASALLVVLCGAVPTIAAGSSVSVSEIHIPPGNLASALNLLARQSGADIVYETEHVRGVRTSGVHGGLSAEQAVRTLLENTNLVVHRDRSGAMLITAARAHSEEAPAPPTKRTKETAMGAGTSRNDAAPLVEEVIVSARKRQETLQNVPVVITAVGQEELEKSQIHDLYTLAARVPGLVMGEQVGVLGPGVTLRGIGTTAFNPAIDQSVSLNVDGLQLSQGFAYQAAMFDVAQVEVLKGPQALFYGKNSPAGVISLRSADPTAETEVVLRTGYEEAADEKLTEMVLSGAPTDALKLRLAAHYSESDGYFRNLGTAPAGGFGMRTPTTQQFGANENWIVRGTVLFSPSETYDARLKLNYTDYMQNYSGGDPQTGTCPGGLTSFTGFPLFDPKEDCRLDRNVYQSWLDKAAFPRVRHDGVFFIESDATFGTLEQNLYFGEYTLTSLTGYYKYDRKSLGNGSGTSGLVTTVSDNDFMNRQFTQEVRLSSDFDALPVNFMAGAFYQDGRMTNQPRIYGNTSVGLPATLRHVIHEIDIESISAFGQLTWDITDSLELAGGARWTREERDHSQFNVASVGVPVGPVIGVDPRLESDNVSPELTLTYRATDDLTIFGAYKQGFKSGSFNATTYIPPTTRLSFGDEKVKGGEVGLKSRLLDRSVALNLATYYYRYEGLQVGSLEVTPSGLIALRTLNAASAKIWGVDFDVSYSPWQLDGLALRGAVSYSHARYGSFPNAPCGNNQTIGEGCDQLFSPVTGRYNAQDLSDEPLARAPEWSLNAGVDYEVPIGTRFTLRLGASATYTSEFDTNIIHRPDFVQEAFVKANANITLQDAAGAWEVALIGNNLSDKITSPFCANANLNGGLIFGGQVSGAAVGGPAGDDYASCSPERGRELWLRLTVRPFEFLRR